MPPTHHANPIDGRPIRSLLNGLLMFGVCVPPALYVASLQRECAAVQPQKAGFEALLGIFGGSSADVGTDELTPVSTGLVGEWLRTLPAADPLACRIYLKHPRLFTNLVYFVVVDVGFYAIYILQRSTWLIDPHWQLIPVCIACSFYSHPDAAGSSDGHHPRAQLSLVLLFVWAARLFYNYIRREGWQLGANEDWRYAQMRRDHGRLFIVSQFFVVSVAQHGMLVGLTMPLQPAMALDGAPLNVHDVVATLLCLVGLWTSWTADNQLFAYMARKDKPLLLETGLWRLSRHPNHFGEQMWWVGLLYFAVAAAGGLGNFLCGGVHVWAVAFGVGFNHPIDTYATLPLIEERMLRRPERAERYLMYQRRTPLVVPFWPSFGPLAKETVTDAKIE